MITQSELKPEHLQILAGLAQKMTGLGIRARFNGVEEGPVVTGYYFTPSEGTPLSKLFKHEEDFALSARVESVTIQRIVGDVVIFVPNKERKTIHFYDSAWFCYSQSNKFEIPISLGVNYLGEKSIIDLTTQPHILLAGQTGSGKSVFLANIIATLAVCKNLQELVFSFIDTKRLDLPLFSELPQVLNLAKDVKDSYAVFKDILQDCRRRYKQLEMKKVRNLKEWNAKYPENKYPYHVVIIDELADLLIQDKDFRDDPTNESFIELENIKSIPSYLQELAQIARAAGIHIIAGTQRPSHKILSGDIKNNLPCKIAMKMGNRFDSETILGESGAETLLGKGDMLVKQEGSDTLKRFHGPFVDIKDIEQVIHNLDDIRRSMEMLK